MRCEHSDGGQDRKDCFTDIQPNSISLIYLGIDRRNRNFNLTTSIRFLTLSIRFWNRNRFSIPKHTRDPLLGCIPSTFDRPVEKRCNRLCLTHRSVTIWSTQRSIEILSCIDKKKLRWYRIGSVLKKWYRCVPTVHQTVV